MTVIIDGTNGVQSVSGSATLASITNINDTNTGMFFPASETIALATSGTERLRLDSAGNMGLGVTPSAWWSSFKVAQVGTASLVSNSGSNAYLGNNFYYNGTNDKRIVASQASRLVQTAGSFIFDQTATGTADSNITWTTAMTLNAAGNLGVGTTTINYRVVADCAGAGSNDNGISVYNDNNSAYGGSYNFEHKVTSGGSVVRAAYISSEGGSGTSFLRFATTNASTLAERVRITSGGNLLVGKTADDATTAGIKMDSGGAIILARNSVSNCFQINKKGNTGDLCAFYYDDASVVGTITNSSTNTAYNTSSDRRLKENIQPADDAGSVIDAIKVVKHDWKVGGHTRYGMIAQDLNEVAPEAVSAGDDGEEIERAWGVDYSKLVPMLVKEIQSLRARLAAAGL